MCSIGRQATKDTEMRPYSLRKVNTDSDGVGASSESSVPASSAAAAAAAPDELGAS